MHSLSIEYSETTKDYLVKVNQGIQKVKLEAYDKIKKKVAYSSGVDYHKGEDNDQAKSNGVNDFKNKAVKIEILEMNLDAKQLAQDQISKIQKEQVLIKQQQKKAEKDDFEQKELDKKELDMEEEGKGQDKSSEDVQKNDNKKDEEKVEKKKNKKKNKKNKKKGLSDFMDDDKELKAYEEDIEPVEEASTAETVS